MLATAKLQTIVCTTNVEAAEQFYRGVLGLTLKARSEGAAVFDVGGGDLRLSPVPRLDPSAHTIVGFAVSDIGAVMASLTERGVQWERFPGFSQDENGVLGTPGGARVAWLRDPDRNLISIVQYA